MFQPHYPVNFQVNQDTILFCAKRSFSFNYNTNQKKNITFENNSQKLFLLSSQNSIFNVIPLSFNISTKNHICHFNLEMLKETSPVISEFVAKNPNENNYYLNISDEKNVLSKFEQLYKGEIVDFNEDDITISKQITELLQIKNCPNFLKPLELYNSIEVDSDGNRIYETTANSKKSVVICKKFFLNYLKKSEQFQTFKIITNRKEYKCNIFGIHSSNVIHQILQKDPTINKFEFNFKDESNEFQSICDFFNFEEVDITSDNMDSLKEITESLQINIVIDKIDDFIKNYDENAQKINEQQTNIDSIDHLFDLLFKIKMHGIQKVKISIAQSKWTQTEESVQELAAFILQVAKSNYYLQREMANLLVLLNEEANEMNKLNILTPFIVNNLMNFYMKSPSNSKNTFNDYYYSSFIDDSGDPDNKYIYNFIRILYKKGIIRKEKIIEKLKFYNCKNQTLNAFFLPELFELNPKILNSITLKLADPSDIDSGFIKKNDDFSLLVDKYFPNKIDIYENMIDNMEPDDELTKSLRNDDVDKLQFIINTNEIDITEAVVPYNIFDDFGTNLNLINYAALYGSIKCFKYLLLNHATVDKASLYFAVYGGNTEIIKIVDDKCPKIDDDDDDDKEEMRQGLTWIHDNKKPIIYSNDDTIIIPAIRMHRNDLFDWFFETKILNKNKFGNILDNIALISAKNGNIHSLIQIADKGIDIASKKIINCAAQNGFYTLTNFLMTMINSKFNKSFLTDPETIQSFVHFGNLSIYKLLNNFIHDQSNSAIVYSIRYNYYKIVKYCFKELCNITFNESFVLSILKEAVKSKTDKWFNYIFEEFKKRDTNVFTLNLYSDILNCACDSSNLSVVKIITDLILKEKSNHNFTNAFIYALTSKSIDICQYLFDKKVYINFEQIPSSVFQIGSIDIKIFLIVIENVSQSTKYKLMKCISQAIQMKNKKLIEYLLKEIQLPEYALFDAVSTHDLEIVNLILDYNCKPSFINLKKPKGTALFVAARNKDLDIVKRLLSLKGIDPSLKNAQNENILTLAIKNCDFDLIELIFNFYGDHIQYKSQFVFDALLLLSHDIIHNQDNKLNWKIVKKLFENKYIDPNYCDSSTFLYKACFYNEIDVVENLLKLDRIDVNMYEVESYYTPLMISIDKNYTKIAELLIQNPKTDLNLRNINDESALIIAVKNEQKYIIDLLINNERFDPIQSKLSFAFYNANSEISKQLSTLSFLDVNYIFEIFDENSQFEKVKTAFVHFVMINDIEKIDFIINHPSFDVYKSDINQALFIAAENNNIEIFRKLIKFIDDINIFNQNSESLLFCSVENLSGNIIDEILNNPKFDPIKSQFFDSFIQLITNKKGLNKSTMNKKFNGWNQQPNYNHTNLLNQDMLPEKSSIIEIVTKIYNFDKENLHLIDFKKLLPNGQSFFTSILIDYDEIGFVSDFLLDHGVDPNMPDSNGLFPLMQAMKLKSFNFISSLINSNKINYSQIGENTTYLHFAAFYVDKNSFNLILEKTKIDINSENKDGRTPLMIACEARNVDVVDLLFEKDDLDYLHSDSSNKNALNLFDGLSQKEFEDSIKSKDAFHQKIISLIQSEEPFFKFFKFS